ncbi:recombinase family protein [Mesorhizobium sp. PAMC28654]|uniref:recombinase family protein n=1 Tax=Mesorhizobium sp. PAMC28654 TaxID=2880934 RepID=UPI001D0BDB04|nr:recombinase family protein [Mesorhizobium sp. PAMC28654]UDL90276.1 recombinase family protein [Mesorhizobium sp. PAMC28654]
MLQPRDLKGRRAISYARWSSGAQASGDSLRRQSENAVAFCVEAGMVLDTEIFDNGVSAFKGANLEAGLGKLVDNIKAGIVDTNMVLILENLDRYSRLDPVDALPRFIDLLKTGLTIVTLQDRRVHTEESYRGNLGNLMQSIVHMSLANEESRKKSERTRAEWASRAAKARQGKVKVSKVPFWIDQKTQGLNSRADCPSSDHLAQIGSQISGVSASSWG